MVHFFDITKFNLYKEDNRRFLLLYGRLTLLLQIVMAA